MGDGRRAPYRQAGRRSLAGTDAAGRQGACPSRPPSGTASTGGTGGPEWKSLGVTFHCVTAAIRRIISGRGMRSPMRQRQTVEREQPIIVAISASVIDQSAMYSLSFIKRHVDTHAKRRQVTFCR